MTRPATGVDLGPARPNRRRLASLVVVSLLIAACVGGQATPPSTLAPTTISTPVATATPVPPTASPTATASAALKADGQIVFYDDGAASAHQQLYIERADGSNVRQLVVSDADDYKPSLSPDGSKVVFSRILHQYTPDEQSRIFLVNADGTGLRQLDATSCVKPKCLGDLADGLAWSPDGKLIAFFRLFGDASGNVTGTGLCVMNADGSGVRQVIHHKAASDTGDGQAAWSPDGTHLVFTREHPQGTTTIFTAKVDGTDVHQVTPAGMSVNDPAWSPDGTLIAFQSPADPAEGVQQGIYTIRPDGTDLRNLTGYDVSIGGSNHASWSPDGSQIVFSHFPSTNGVADLFVVNRDGTDVHLLSATSLNENAPAWGPVSTDP